MVPQMIYVLGGMGAGKTTYIEQVLKPKLGSNFQFILFDCIMKALPSFPKANEPVISWPPHLRSRCYLEAMEISTLLIADAVARKQSFVIEGTGMNLQSNLEDMKKQQSLGYKIILHHIHCLPDFAATRIEIRNLSGIENRKVLPKLAFETYARLQENISAYKAICDEYVEIIQEAQVQNKFSTHHTMPDHDRLVQC